MFSSGTAVFGKVNIVIQKLLCYDEKRVKTNLKKNDNNPKEPDFCDPRYNINFGILSPPTFIYFPVDIVKEVIAWL